MPKIQYIVKRFSKSSLDIVEKANDILESYAQQGFDLTLRQTFYQFVSRNWISNTQESYKRLGSIINDARLAGLTDWSSIVDRTRNLRSLSHWDDPSEIIDSAAYSFRLDKWEDQDYYPEVWIEKDSLIGIIEGPCNNFDVPYFSCRGYNSQSEMWRAAERFRRRCKDGNRAGVLIHLSDHDPSGLDMKEDIVKRFETFIAGFVVVKRIGLTMDQINQYNLPPNPAKVTDSRFMHYVQIYGAESWELDALDPTVLSDLVRDEITSYINFDRLEDRKKEEENGRDLLEKCANRWSDVREFLE